MSPQGKSQHFNVKCDVTSPSAYYWYIIISARYQLATIVLTAGGDTFLGGEGHDVHDDGRSSDHVGCGNILFIQII